MFKIALKDIRLFLRDRKAILLTLLVPIILVSLFAIAFGGLGKMDRSTPTLLLISDQDNTMLSREIVHNLDSGKSLELEPSELGKAKDAVKAGKRLAVLVFYAGFSDSIEQGKKVPMELFYDESREIEIGLLQQALMSNLMGVLSGEDPFTGGMELEMTKLAADEQINWALIQSVSGVAVMMLLFSVTAMGSTILEEKEKGTLKKLLYSPIRPSQILFGKMLYTLFISSFQLTILMVYSWLVFDLDIFNNVPGLIVIILSTAFACTGFGILLASVSKSRKQVEGLSIIIILIMSAIGGSMIPIFLMPAFMQKMAIVSVNYWSIQGFYDILGRDLPFVDILPKALVLFGIGFVLSIISSIMFKRNILKVV